MGFLSTWWLIQWRAERTSQDYMDLLQDAFLLDIKKLFDFRLDNMLQNTHIFVGNTQSTGSMIGNMLQWLSVRILDWCCPFFSDKGTHCQSGKYGHEACYSLERPNSSLGFTNYTHHYILGYPQILEPRTSSRFIGYSDSHILMYNHIHISWYPYCDWFF